MIDLGAYLDRIDLEEDLRPDLASLEALHLAHLSAIPFENVDVRLGRTIRLDLASLQAKLVQRRRGGYCFEQNTLFAAVLREIGFEVEALEARVRPRGVEEVMARTHMALRVRFEGGDYLADVGFGGSGPLLPVPFDGAISHQPDGEYALSEEATGTFVLRTCIAGAWWDQYAFGLAPALAIDFEVANHYTSTYPESPFVHTLTAQRSRASHRLVLRGRTLTTRIGEEETVREISAEDVPTVLREGFGLEVTDGEAMKALGRA